MDSSRQQHDDDARTDSSPSSSSSPAPPPSSALSALVGDRMLDDDDEAKDPNYEPIDPSAQQRSDTIMELFGSDTEDTVGASGSSDDDGEPPRQRRRFVVVNDSDDEDDDEDEDDEGDSMMTINAQDLLNSMFSSGGGGDDDEDDEDDGDDDEDASSSGGTSVGSLQILRYLLRSGQVRIRGNHPFGHHRREEYPAPGSVKLVDRLDEDIPNFLEFQHQVHVDTGCCPHINFANKRMPSRPGNLSDSTPTAATTSSSSPTDTAAASAASSASSSSSAQASSSGAAESTSSTQASTEEKLDGGTSPAAAAAAAAAAPSSAILWSKSLKKSTFKLMRDREVHTSRRLVGGRKAAVLRARVPNKLVSSFAYHRQDSRLFCAKFSKDGSTFCSASQTGISIVDAETWREIKWVPGNDVGWSIIDVDYSPLGNFIAYSKWSDDVHVVNTYGDHQLHDPHTVLDGNSRSCIFGVKFSPNNVHLLCGASAGQVVVYDMTTKKAITRLRGAHDDDINSVTYLDNNDFLYATGSDDTMIKVWDTRVSTKSRNAVGAFIGHEQGLTCVATKGDGRYVLSNSKDQCMKLWDMRKISPPSAARHAGLGHRRDFDYRYDAWVRGRYPRKENDHSIMSYAGHKVQRTLIRCNFSPLRSTGQSYVYTGSADSEIVVYDALSGKVVQRLSGHGNSIVRDVTWHPERPEICGASWDGAVLRFVHDEARDCKHLGPARGKARAHEDVDDGSFGRGSMAARRRRRREQEECKTSDDSSSTSGASASSSPAVASNSRTRLCTEEWGARGVHNVNRMDPVRFGNSWF